MNCEIAESRCAEPHTVRRHDETGFTHAPLLVDNRRLWPGENTSGEPAGGWVQIPSIGVGDTTVELHVKRQVTGIPRRDGSKPVPRCCFLPLHVDRCKGVDVIAWNDTEAAHGHGVPRIVML